MFFKTSVKIKKLMLFKNLINLSFPWKKGRQTSADSLTQNETFGSVIFWGWRNIRRKKTE